MFHDYHCQPVQRRREPFDHADWLFELKYDGFRALAKLQHGRCELESRNQHAFKSFSTLSANIANLHIESAVIDGEIVCIDRQGKPQFRDLLFHRAEPYFFAFDLLYVYGLDLRNSALIDRKLELRRVLSGLPKTSRICYADHVEGLGRELFARACDLDLEGIVAKQRFAPHETDREESSWFKIRNPRYSQWAGREELFDRERESVPVAGWHTCELACAEIELREG
jgi:bifunctional non-homologous end joining protein LigD